MVSVVFLGCVCWSLLLVCYYGRFGLGLVGVLVLEALLTLFVFS